MSTLPLKLFHIASVASAVALTLAVLSGCAGNEEAAAIKQNLSDAEIRIDGFESRGELYALRGHVVSATPVGGSAAMAEPGQEITLTPWFPGGRPDPSNPTHSRLLTLPGVPPGSTIRCRIGLDAGGAWRIISIN
jgi:hypothetical protein